MTIEGRHTCCFKYKFLTTNRKYVINNTEIKNKFTLKYTIFCSVCHLHVHEATETIFSSNSHHKQPIKCNFQHRNHWLGGWLSNNSFQCFYSMFPYFLKSLIHCPLLKCVACTQKLRKSFTGKNEPIYQSRIIPLSCLDLYIGTGLSSGTENCIFTSFTVLVQLNSKVEPILPVAPKSSATWFQLLLLLVIGIPYWPPLRLIVTDI